MMQRAVMVRQRHRKPKPAQDRAAPPEYPGLHGHREPCHAPDHDYPKDHPATKVPPGRAFYEDQYKTGYFAKSDIEAFDGRWVYASCPASTGKCPHCMNHVYHIGCLVVSISGAFSTTGPKPRSSIGIFYGRNNRHNFSAELKGEKHTEQIAELQACIEALTRTYVLHNKSQMEPVTSLKYEAVLPLNTVVIKSDSEYLVKGVTEWLPKWKENGWKRNCGQPVANAELWKSIDSMLKYLEHDIKVKFWHVAKEMNQISTMMAKHMLDEA